MSSLDYSEEASGSGSSLSYATKKEQREAHACYEGCPQYNDGCCCCGGTVQRFLYLGFGIVIFIMAAYAGSHLGSLRVDSYNATQLGQFKDTNIVSETLVDFAEMAAVLSCAAGLALCWHALKWNVASNWVCLIVVACSFGLNMVTSGFYFKQLQKDRATTNPNSASSAAIVPKKDINANVLAAGSSAVVNAVFLLIVGLGNLIFWKAGFKSAHGQTDCCENCLGEEINNDCCQCGCKCSFGRILIFVVAIVYGFIVLIRASATGNWVNEYIDRTKDGSLSGSQMAAEITFCSFDLIRVSLLSTPFSATFLMFLVIHSLFWNVTTQTIALFAGFVSIATEAWVSAYGMRQAHEHDDNKNSSAALDNRLKSIQLFAILSVVAALVQWVLVWFFSDAYRKYDIDEDEEDEPNACAECCYSCGAGGARLLIAVGAIILFVFSIITCSFSANYYNMYFTSKASDDYSGNAATPWFVPIAMFAAGASAFTSVIGIVHFISWNRITAATGTFGFVLSFFCYLLAAALGTKQAELGDPLPTATQKPLEPELKSLYSFTVLATITTAVVAVFFYLFSCNFNKADFGEDRGGGLAAGESAEDSSDQDYTYATAGSYSY